MATQKVNKSAMIREYKAAHPGAGATEIAEALSKGRRQITGSFVSTILSQDRRKTNGHQPNGITKSRPKTRRMKFGDTKLNLDSLVAAKKFISNVGGVEKARACVEVLNELLA
jgi:hypothetical protein